MQQHGRARVRAARDAESTGAGAVALAGNRALQRALSGELTVSRWSVQDATGALGSALTRGGEALATVMAGARGITGSVGRGGKNRPEDVATVEQLLRAVGFLTGAVSQGGGDELADAIKRYQSDVLGFPEPDGRVDPGGKTIGALVEGRKASPTAQGDAGDAGGGPAPDPTSVAGPDSGPAAGTAAGAAGTPAGVEELVTEVRTIHKQAERHKGKHSEEEAGDRAELIKGIAEVRTKVAALTADGLHVDKATLASIKARLYREIDAASPYYYQIDNKDVLGQGEGKKHYAAGGRTCNVTSISMALEALGKTPKEFTGDFGLLASIAGRFPDLGPGATDPTTLRMPDFLQLVAIYVYLGKSPPSPREDADGFAAAVEKARQTAAGKIVQNYEFDNFTELFSVPAKVHENPHGKELEGFGEVIRGATGAKDKQGKTLTPEQMREYLVGKEDKQLEALAVKLAAKTGKQAAAIQKQIDALKEKKEITEATASPEQMEQKLPVETYKASVLKPVSTALDQGKQVICSMYNHFTRLQSIDDAGIVLDDPGRFNHVDWTLTWEKAREIGCFLRWTELG